MNEDRDFYQLLRLYLQSQNQQYPGVLNPLLDYILLPSDLLHLIVKLLLDETVPLREKVKVLLALLYYVSPLDLIPDMLLGPVGLVDDIAVAIYVLDSLLNTVQPETVERSWAGDRQLLFTLQRLVGAVDGMMGGSLLHKLDPVLYRLFP